MPICNKCNNVVPQNWFYKHPQTKSWYASICKECAKKRQSLCDRKEYDRGRYKNNPERRAYIFKSSTKRRIIKWYWNIHCKAERAIKKYGRPNICSVCSGTVDWINILRIVFHHPNYEKPYEWVFCCEVCHSKIHLWKVKDYKIINILIETIWNGKLQRENWWLDWQTTSS